MKDSLTENNFDHCTTRTGGFCKKCAKEHWLGPGNTLIGYQEIKRQFNKSETIDLLSSTQNKVAALDLSYLFGPARGKMFGLMECRKPDGSIILLRAFSGQYNGSWQVDGWVPPLFDVDQFNTTTFETEKKIKQIGQKITQCLAHSDIWLELRKQRRQLSQNLMQDIHALYSLTNFRGETVGLSQAYTGDNGIPTGTGDCCAPKLLNFAAKNNFRPLGLIEFYWGKENKSGTRRHGSVYSSCVEKCQPILGFLLCGLDD